MERHEVLHPGTEEVNATLMSQECGVLKNADSIKGDVKLIACIELIEFDDGVVLYGVTTETDNTSDENTVYFSNKTSASKYARKIL